MRFERRSEPVASRQVFMTRLGRAMLAAAVLVAGMLGVGMAGYAFFEGMGFIDAYLNAAMILSGMGPVGQLNTVGGKLFAGTYAIVSGFVVIAVSGIVLAPVIHRWLHAFHVDRSK